VLPQSIHAYLSAACNNSYYSCRISVFVWGQEITAGEREKVLNSRAAGTLLLTGGSIDNVNVREGKILAPFLGWHSLGFGARDWAS
jgi:hypothetical protein